MPYRLFTDGTIETDTLDELRSLQKKPLGRPAANNEADPAVPAKRKRRRRSSGKMKAMWAAARKLAKRDGISVREARSKLSAAKK